MIQHPPTPLDLFSEAQQTSIIQAAFHILANTGLLIQSEEATRQLRRAGCMYGDGDHLLFPRDVCDEHLSTAPSCFTLHGRDSRHDVQVCGDHLLLSPGYGSAFVADAEGRRREAGLGDFQQFARLAHHSDLVDITGGLLVEPADVPPHRRPVVLTRALLQCSAKPLLGSVAGDEGARQSIDVVRIVHPDLEARPAVLGLININSPLRLDARMAQALLVYVRSGQPIILTPGILMGITAPVTVAGALAQAFAELIGCVVLTQALRPGAPVAIGTGGFGSDLRMAGSGFGRPEQALSNVLAACLARKLRLPYRASPGVTGAFTADARAGYESMMTAFAAWSSGAHLCLQALGILDHINAMSYEKFALDLEVWAYLARIASPTAVTDEALAMEAIAELPADYLAADHTMSHFRRELLTPALCPALSYDAWQETGGPDTLKLARERVKAMLAEAAPPPLPDDVSRRLAAL